MRILFLGDISGSSGREVVKSLLPGLKKEYTIDLIFANIENVASGQGVTVDTLDEMLDAGIDFATSGDHIWRFKNIIQALSQNSQLKLLRPANYPPTTPGKGFVVVNHAQSGVLLINLLGRQFMKPHVDDPYRTVDQILNQVPRNEYQICIVDLHAEATSEKQAMGWYLDGKVSAVLGTHTHVGTADARILPQGTAYITDVGMCGAQNSVLGVKKEIILKKERDQISEPFEIETQGPKMLNGVLMTFNDLGKAESIERMDRFI